MMITKKAIPRRTVLRGIGAAIALPFLDSMTPALTALKKTAAQGPRRLSAIYLPNGIAMASWTPADEGRLLALPPTLQPLASFQDDLLVLSGLSSKPPVNLSLAAAGPHARASTRFLTGVPPKYAVGSEIAAGVSADQLAAVELGRDTQLASLELALESAESVGDCDLGYSCAYTNTIAWRSATTPLPMEVNPRIVFERLFGDSRSTDPRVRAARLENQRSMLDSVRDAISARQRELGPRDRAKLDEYLESVRDVERRIQNAEKRSDIPLPTVEQPAGIPPTFEAHAKLMFDLQALAFQSDLTRVITFMVGREFSGRTYPQLGIPDAHHPLSHHQNDRAKVEKIAKIDAYHVTLFSYFLDKLRSTLDGDGSLLDRMTILYGAGMSDGNQHAPENLPILLIGGRADREKGARHVRYPSNTPLANLHVTILDHLGVHVDRLGDSTGRIEGLHL
jgi:hypothetical protein